MLWEGNENKLNKVKSSLNSIDKYLEDGEVTPKAIAMAAGDGDALSIRVLEETGKILGSVLATLVNALNPQAIIIGGGVSNAGDLLFGPVRQIVEERVMRDINVRIVPAALGDDCGLLGAAALALKQDTV